MWYNIYRKLRERILVIDMNLGINKNEAIFLKDVILHFIESSRCPDLIIEIYPLLGVDIRDILKQLEVIEEIGEEPAEGDMI